MLLRRTVTLATLTLAAILAGCGGGSTTPVGVDTATNDTGRNTLSTTVPAGTTTVDTTTFTQATTDPAGEVAPTSFAEARSAFGSGTPTDQPILTFEDPTGSTYCDISPDAAVNGCELTGGKRMMPPEAVPPCAPEVGGIGRIEFTQDGATEICNSDTIVTPGAATLPYGRIARVSGGALACLSRQIGMTCIDTDREVGFFIRSDAGGYVTF